MAAKEVCNQERWAKTVSFFFAKSSYIVIVIIWQEQSKVLGPSLSKTDEVDSEDT